MPGYDRSGPMGNGPMSGGGHGLCGSAAHQREFDYSEKGKRGGPGCRRGFGKSGGGRFQRGYRFLVDPAEGGQTKDEKEILETEARKLQRSLTRIQQRLDQL